MSDAYRQGAESYILTGTVVSKLESQPSQPYEVRIDGTVEILVESVQKGAGVAVGERVAVHYWRMEPNPNRPAPGHYGHWGIPAEADRVQVFVAGDVKTGLRVLGPNGFQKPSP